jgi:D-alanyl-lipoteichoic acid acyltransferase DltB (MBOAT superfamily)
MLDGDLFGGLARTANLALMGRLPAAVRAWTGDAAALVVASWLIKAALLLVAVNLAVGLRRLPNLAVPAGALGLLLLVWILGHPTPHVHQLVSRIDHLFMAVLLGASLSRTSLALRTTVLTILSLALLVAHFGWRPVVICGASALLAWAALQPEALRGRRATVVTQSGALGFGAAGLLFVREHNFFAALLAQGLFAFLLLRQVSFAVEVRRGRSAAFRDWACYQGFYLSSFASQLYDEFHDWNLATRPTFAPRAVAAGLVGGSLLVAAAALLPVTFADVLATTRTGRLWAVSLALYVRSTVGLMGFWAMLEAIALLYDVRLRPNWPRTILATNPSAFWRSWRATMTWWLIRYVYIPLGGNRRHQMRNIAAAFAVSMLWHWSGIPFLDTPVRVRGFLPVAAWAVLNATGVAAWAAWRRTRPPPARRPLWRSVTALLLTALFGSFTVTLLAFEPRVATQLPAYLRRLIGL